MTQKLGYKTISQDIAAKNTNKQHAEMIIVLFFSFIIVGVMAQIPRPDQSRPEPQISAISSQSK